jgi:hypothetical protein
VPRRLIIGDCTSVPVSEIEVAHEASIVRLGQRHAHLLSLDIMTNICYPWLQNHHQSRTPHLGYSCDLSWACPTPGSAKIISSQTQEHITFVPHYPSGILVDHPSSSFQFKMKMSVEAIVAIIAIVVTLPHTLLILWNILCRLQRKRQRICKSKAGSEFEIYILD